MRFSEALGVSVIPETWTFSHLSPFLMLLSLSFVRRVVLPTSCSNIPKQTALCLHSDLFIFKRVHHILSASSLGVQLLPTWSVALESSQLICCPSAWLITAFRMQLNLLPKLVPPPIVSGLGKSPSGRWSPGRTLITIASFLPLSKLPPVQ